MKTTMGIAVLLAALASAAALEIGKEVPDITFKSIEDKELKLSDMTKEGKVVAVVSWSPSCPSGKNCISRATEIAGKFAGEKKVQFIAVCSYGDTRESLKEYCRQNGITYMVCYDEGGKIARHFGARKVNSAYVVREGKLFWRGGILADGKDSCADAITAAVEGKPAPPSDREKLG